MRSVSIAGLLLMVAAVALMLWGRFTFGRRSFHAAADPTEGGLVTTGPYHFIRHPIYTAACAFCWAGIMANGSVPSMVGGVLLTVGGIMRMLAEDRLLVDRYPEYLRYANGTKRMVFYVF